MTKTLTDALCAYAAGTDFAAVPADARERVKLILFDEWSCALVGRELSAGDLIARHVVQSGGVAESSLIGTRARLPSALAALANGTAGHANEFDGAHVTDGHPGAVVVHAATAVAEAMRSDGKALINAVALGYDIGTRMVSACGGAFDLRSRVHIHSDHLHSYGAAMACARLMGLSAHAIRHAAALTAGQAGGLATVFEERRHLSKALSTGLAASAGVTSARLAATGFEGHDNVFDSGHGPLAWAPADPRPAMTRALGDDFAVMGSNFKFYSAGYPIHAPVEAALTLMAENQIAAADVTRVDVHLATGTADTVNNRDMPSICVQDMVALAMVAGNLDFDTAHSAAWLADPAVRALRARVQVVADPEIDRIQPRGRGGKVVLHAASGARHAKWVEHPRGHALRAPVGWDGLVAKWQDLLPRRLGARGFERFVSLCRALDMIEDIAEIMHLLEGTK